MTDFSKIGRNNKNRGREFEKKVANTLGWTRVPYSGAISSWGYGDVVDGFYKQKGFWSAECKTQQPGPLGTISVTQKYIKQMDKGSDGQRKGLLVIKNVGELRSYVVMPTASFEQILDHLLPSEYELVKGMYPLNSAGTADGFVVPVEYLKYIKGLGVVASFMVESPRIGTERGWCLMTLDTFKYYIKKHDIMEYDDESKRNDSRF